MDDEEGSGSPGIGIIVWVFVGLLVFSIIVFVILPLISKGQDQTQDLLKSQLNGGNLAYSSVEGEKDAQITEAQYSEKTTPAQEPEPTQPVSSLAPGEQPREWNKISKEDFVKAIKEAFVAERGVAPTRNQLKAIYSIAAFEQGAIGKKEIGAFNWNFGNIHLRSAKQFMLGDMGFSQIYDGKKHLEYVAAVKKYAVDNKISLVTGTPYYWSADSNGKTGADRAYYYAQFQAFGTPADGLRRKVSLISNTYPGALDDKKLSAVSENGEKASIVASGLKHGDSGYSYYEAPESTYAGGLKSNMDDFDRMNIG